MEALKNKVSKLMKAGFSKDDIKSILCSEEIGVDPLVLDGVFESFKESVSKDDKKPLSEIMEKVLKFLSEKMKIDLEEFTTQLNKNFNISIEDAEKWPFMLEEFKLAKIKYPLFGKPYIVIENG